MTSSEPPLPALIDFVADEERELRASLARDHADVALWAEIQGFYEEALAEVKVHENEIPIFQLLTFSHYYFLSASAALLRCHLSEMFGAIRIAIDAALNAAQIIADRGSQIAWVKKQKPFDNLFRYYGNLIQAGRPLPNELVKPLIDLHKKLSGISSHADVGMFVHRTTTTKQDDGHRIFVKYFQCSDDSRQRRVHALTLAHAFVMVLDVFADFLVDEQKKVPARWRDDLHAIGYRLQEEQQELKASLAASRLES